MIIGMMSVENYLVEKAKKIDWFISKKVKVLDRVIDDAGVAPAEPVASLGSEVAHAATSEGEKSESPSTLPTELIKKYFGDGSPMIEIASCESQMQADKIGDKHLAFWHDGQLYGRSIGLFQIRTGGREKGRVWVRSENVKEFEEKMMIPEENVKMAKQVFDSGGYSRWYNCSKKLGIID